MSVDLSLSLSRSVVVFVVVVVDVIVDVVNVVVVVIVVVIVVVFENIHCDSNGYERVCFVRLSLLSAPCQSVSESRVGRGVRRGFE